MGRNNYIHIIKTTPEKLALFEDNEAYLDFWKNELYTKEEVKIKYENDKIEYGYDNFEGYIYDNYTTYEYLYDGGYFVDHRAYKLNESEVLLIIAICD